MRCTDAGDTFDDLLDACLAELLPQLVYKVCWRVSEVTRTVPTRENPPQACDCLQASTQPPGETLLHLGFMQTDSQGLCRNLQGCDKIILFAATVGLAPDRLIARYGRLSPTKALCMQAIGAERIESLCDAFCDELAADYAAEGYQLRPRFSPGYGRFPARCAESFLSGFGLSPQNRAFPQRQPLDVAEQVGDRPHRAFTAGCADSRCRGKVACRLRILRQNRLSVPTGVTVVACTGGNAETRLHICGSDDCCRILIYTRSLEESR